MRHQIDVYISDDCLESQRMVDYLSNYDIPINVKNTTIDKDNLRQLQEEGIYLTPAMVIDHHYSVIGFQENKIKNMLNLHGEASIHQ
ncbi:hypothetical protein SH601_10045 [Gracilibacillus sp. S3-1-1]|uniref:Uncharacterized protein n=1 Tax=Gracilibacillus pellucidus TaxID=3095368 RepID=A0ACC6M5S7_9BACI|nr:hypothetical protein [Gracilibacillus sp. S3-1-1]MDX8046320.1 hypothetical protein [Gracilibacillus sp. S3-1-1]